MPKRLLRAREGTPLLDIASYARAGRSDRILLPAHVAQIARTVRRVPEVMVKVSGGGTSPKAVAAHLKYIGRKDFQIETDDGEKLDGKEAGKRLVGEWDLEMDALESQSKHSGKPGRKPSKLVHNIVLSMPAGTSPDGLLAASRTFAREQFAFKHRYALALHTDEAHPHVHLVVRAAGDQGQRLNIYKATLREWRSEFARHLRAQGIAANATERVVRGVTRPRKLDGIHRPMTDSNRVSTHMQQRAESVATELLAGTLKAEPGKTKLIETRRPIELGWRVIALLLSRNGRVDLAAEATDFVKRMEPPRSEREWVAQDLLKRARDPRIQARPR